MLQSRTRVSKETLAKGPLKQMRGNEILLGEDVDRGLLLRFPKDQGFWVDEEGDPAILVAQHFGVFLKS